MAAGIQEGGELSGFFGISNPHQTIDRESRTANPAIAVIPIARASRAFRKAAGGRRHNRAGRLISQQFQDQCRASHYFSSAAAVCVFGHPVAPAAYRFRKRLFALLFANPVFSAGSAFRNLIKLEAPPSSLTERESPDHSGAGMSQRDSRS